MLATVNSAVVDGVDGVPVRVEVDVRDGLPSYSVVGMPDAACRESRDRVRAALGNSGLRWPQRRITVNLAPSSVRKQGAGLDLPIAIAILIADGQLPVDCVAELGMAGELGLDGSIRRVPGMIIIAEACPGKEFLAPKANEAEVALIRAGEVRVVSTLFEFANALAGNGEIPPRPVRVGDAAALSPELSDVRGQHTARLALEVAAAGGHHLLMIGPPGAGKTMLARRLPGLLPDLDDKTAIVATRIHSAAGLDTRGLVRRPPFRAPHHGASTAALIGGGGMAIRPGEVSAAHGGVLFLDELGEFSVPVLEGLRQPLEEGIIRVSRLTGPRKMPARFQLVAATNPCPCGFGISEGACSCSSIAKARYLRRLSGPLVDRFDLRIRLEVSKPLDLLGSEVMEESTEVVGKRVAAAREIAASRGVSCNARIPDDQLNQLAPLSAGGRAVLIDAMKRGQLTGRGVNRVRRVARTLADLLPGVPEELNQDVIDQALQMRRPVEGEEDR